MSNEERKGDGGKEGIQRNTRQASFSSVTAGVEPHAHGAPDESTSTAMHVGAVGQFDPSNDGLGPGRRGPDSTGVPRPSDWYSMRQPCAGLAVVIGNGKYPSYPPVSLPAAFNDARLIGENLRTLGFELFSGDVLRSQSTDELRQVFRDIQDMDAASLDKYDSFLLYYSGHGDQGAILGSDKEELSHRWIINAMSPRNCPAFATKPRIFLMDTCKGGVRRMPGTAPRPIQPPFTPQDHLLFAHTCEPKQVIIRHADDTKTHSKWTRFLSSGLRKSVLKRDIEEVLWKVELEMAVFPGAQVKLILFSWLKKRVLFTPRVEMCWQWRSRFVSTCKGHTKRVNCIAALGTTVTDRLVSGSSDGAISLWKVEHTEGLDVVEYDTTPLRSFGGHSGSVRAVNIVDEDGKMIVSGGWDKTVKTWDSLTGSVIHTFKGHTLDVSTIARLTTSGTGSFITGSGDSTLRTWDVRTRGPVSTFKGHTREIYQVTALADYEVASACGDGTVKVWDTRRPERFVAECRGHQGAVHSVQIMGGGRLITGSYDSTVKYWSSRSGMCSNTLRGHDLPVRGIVAMNNMLTQGTPDGVIASACVGGRVRIWDVRSCLTLSVSELESPVWSMCIFNVNNIAAALENGTIRVINGPPTPEVVEKWAREDEAARIKAEKDRKRAEAAEAKAERKRDRELARKRKAAAAAAAVKAKAEADASLPEVLDGEEKSAGAAGTEDVGSGSGSGSGSGPIPHPGHESARSVKSSTSLTSARRKSSLRLDSSRRKKSVTIIATPTVAVEPVTPIVTVAGPVGGALGAGGGSVAGGSAKFANGLPPRPSSTKR